MSALRQPNNARTRSGRIFRKRSYLTTLALFAAAYIAVMVIATHIADTKYVDAVTQDFKRQGFGVIDVDRSSRTATVKTSDGRVIDVVVSDDGEGFSPGVFCPLLSDRTVATTMCTVRSS